MNSLALLLLVLTLPVNIFAQSPQTQSDPPDLTIIKHSWRKETVYQPILTADPMRANDDQAALNRARRDNSSSNKVRVQEGTRPEQTTVPNTKPKPSDPGGQDRYVYRVTVKNSGTKTITNVVWNYGQIPFETQVKIGTGKSTELIGKSSKLPTFVIDATNAAEEVVIRRIQYEDGSFWERPDIKR